MKIAVRGICYERLTLRIAYESADSYPGNIEGIAAASETRDGRDFVVRNTHTHAY